MIQQNFNNLRRNLTDNSHITLNYVSIDIHSKTHISLNVFDDSKKFLYANVENDKICKCIIDNNNLLLLIQILITSNRPLILCFPVFASFFSENIKNTGIMSLPTLEELDDDPIGYHEVAIVGYELNCIIIMNFWNKDRELNGYLKMPIEYLTYSYRDDYSIKLMIIMPILQNYHLVFRESGLFLNKVHE